MASVFAIIAPLVLVLAAPLGAAPIPACVSSFVSGEAAIEPIIPAPTITPEEGNAGDPIVVTGHGATPGATVTVIGLYGEDDCSIAGLGDQLLGMTKADEDGRFTLRRPWPSVFRPLLGREDVGDVPLPAGRYYIIAFECSDAGSCARAGASAPGGPYRFGAPATPADDPAVIPAASPGGQPNRRAPALALAGASLLATGVIVLRRLARAR